MHNVKIPTFYYDRIITSLQGCPKHGPESAAGEGILVNRLEVTWSKSLLPVVIWKSVENPCTKGSISTKHVSCAFRTRMLSNASLQISHHQH